MVTWGLTILGIIVLVVLHEAGHFVAAKAVGMRVERFALGLGPLVGPRFRRGETEYGIAPLPLGGYVKITGMNPHEEIPPEVAHRAYYRQAVWKRIVVIVAGPAVNVVLAFLIFWGLFMIHGLGVPQAPRSVVAAAGLQPPAAGALRPGDRLISVDGRRGSPDQLRAQIGSHRCAGSQTDGCLAASPARVVVERAGRPLTFDLRPRYSAQAQRPLLGFGFETPIRYFPQPPGEAAVASLDRMWFITERTMSVFARLYDAEQRQQLGGIVGASVVLEDSFEYEIALAILILGAISFALALINLFPFLPLDGGHIFWALAEKVRGKPIRFEVMERSMAVGFVLVLALFVIGLSNDIGRIQDGSLTR